MMVGTAQAAKVLVVYNPWYNAPALKDVVPQMWGGLVNWSKDASSTTQLTATGGNWYSYTFASATPGGFTLLNRSFPDGVERWREYKSQGYDSLYTGVGTEINVDSYLAASDTVWMVPDPLVGGAPRFLTQHPKQKILEFWNPWESDFPGQAPAVRVGTGAWSNLLPSAAGAGWYQLQLVGYANLDLQFRSANGARFLGGAGITTTAGTSVRFDSLAASDTIWVHQFPEPSGKPVAQSSKPRGRVVEVFNPWDGQFPFRMPMFQFADGDAVMGQPIYERCGWYRVVRYDQDPSSVYFSNSANVTFGTAGMGSKTGFSLSAFWAAGDTVKISPDSMGVWAARTQAFPKTGQCFLTKLGATIRDFAESHPAFNKFDCGVTKNMVQDTLGPNRKPLAAPGAEKCLNGTIAQWFNDVPSVNYSVCRDIPLGLNPVDGLYTYNDQNYFPIDNVDSTLDKFNVKYKADDGLMHNFLFCLESHAVFDYHKGQKFDFIGDDDVWVYINNKLAVDLGGVHVADTLSVSLDDLNLTEGKTYPFDFFFCERKPTASHMLITTSMNLRNPPEFELRETGISTGKRQYDLFYHQKIGQGCDAQRIDKATPGLFFLTGPQFPAGIQLGTGVQLGGLTIRGDSAQLVYDSLAMDRLKPGTYVIRVAMALDTTQYKNIIIVIPNRPMPQFVLHDPWNGRIGTSMPLDVDGWVGPDRANFAISYKLDPVPGLRFCQDSACTQVIAPGTLSSTGAAGQTSRIWVRGDAIGVYSLKLRNSLGDSADYRTRIVFQDRGLRWLDSTGNVVQPSAIVLDPGSSVRLWIEATQGDVRCDTCSDVLMLEASNTNVRFLNVVSGAQIASTTLVKGRGSVLVASDLPAASVKVTAVESDSSLWLSWSPITWVPWTLVFLDSAGSIPGPSFLNGEILELRKGTIQVMGRNGICTKCSGTIDLDPSLGIKLIGAKGDSISSVVATAGKAAFSFVTNREVLSGSIAGNLAAYSATGSLSPLNFIAPPPDSGAWYDDDGDGRPDHLKGWLHLAWTSATKIQAAWPTSSSAIALDPTRLSVSTNGKIVEYTVPGGIEGGTYSGATDLGLWSRDGDPFKSFPIHDRVAPVPMRAIIHRGTVWDTLRVLPSEGVKSVVDKDDVLRKLGLGGALPSYDFSKQWTDPVTGEFVFLFSATQNVDVPVPGDSVRFAPSGMARDVFGNAPGLKAKAVPIYGTDRPPADAVMLDSDGDGRADRVVLRLKQPLGAKESWLFRWPDSSGGLDERSAETISAIVDSNGLKLTFDLRPFLKGQTACPVSGCANLGSIVGVYEGVSLSTYFPIRDGVPPIVLRGKMTFSGEDDIPDTIAVRFSEPVVSRSDLETWISIGDTTPGSQGKTIVPWSVKLDSTGTRAIFLVDTNVVPLKGQGLRLNSKLGGGLSDLAGNFPQDTAAWGTLELGPMPPRLGATAYPAIGRWDGTAPDLSEPVLRLMVRRGIGTHAEWKTLDGQTYGIADTLGHSDLVGAKLQLNDATAGGAYLYDNMGVFVAYIDLTPVMDALKKGSIETDPRGKYEVWVAWNGVANGKIAPSGIYLMRIIAYRKVENRTAVQQKVVRMGWMIFGSR